jgi:hypothetical protein
VHLQCWCISTQERIARFCISFGVKQQKRTSSLCISVGARQQKSKASSLYQCWYISTEKGQQGVVVPTGHATRSKSYWQAHLREKFHGECL